ncbi:unnamed protein product, partial [Ixodes persulcatus]
SRLATVVEVEATVVSVAVDSEAVDSEASAVATVDSGVACPPVGGDPNDMVKGIVVCPFMGELHLRAGVGSDGAKFHRDCHRPTH